MAYENLITLDKLNRYWEQKEFFPLAHQIKVADKVVNKLEGRALLADEVGLGKTIEAGLILKEYLLREEISNCLILTPASLAYQWWQELSTKFNIDLFNNRKGRSWKYFDVVIGSLDRAKLEPHRSKILERDFDMVIVDEAQHLKNKKTKNWQFINSLTPNNLLLLTATPLENNLTELSNLLKLLKPKVKRELEESTSSHKKVLKETLDKYMLRNSREQLKDIKKERRVKTCYLKLSPAEEKIYYQLKDLIIDKFTLLTLHRELCSSPLAVIKTIDILLQKEKIEQKQAEELINLLAEIEENNKVKNLKDIINNQSGKSIIFTRYKASQHYLNYHLKQAGYNTFLFSGDLSENKKEFVKRLFKKQGDILISTEAGAQGINLQFCNQIINYDLSWNPMKLEQRAGRIHRLGQDKDVLIYNLITEDTIEETLEERLTEKINLFEEMIGDVERII